jgi:tetratricopeptide (TPR) repeat protein
MAKGDYDGAIKNLEASIELDCNVFETYYNLGVAYIEARQFDKAVCSLEKALKLNPRYAESYYSLAIAKESLADEMSESNNSQANISTSSVIKENYTPQLSNTDKELMVENYRDAISYFNKYIDMNIPDNKKEEITSHIKDIEKVLLQLEY